MQTMKRLSLHGKQLIKGIQTPFCAEKVGHTCLVLCLPSLCRILIAEELCFYFIRIGSTFSAKHLLFLREVTEARGKFSS